MKEDINILISKTVGEIIPTYAVLADIDNGVKMSLCLLPDKTIRSQDERVCRSIYDTGVFFGRRYL